VALDHACILGFYGWVILDNEVESEAPLAFLLINGFKKAEFEPATASGVQAKWPFNEPLYIQAASFKARSKRETLGRLTH
jgi:hypothetical protein